MIRSLLFTSLSVVLALSGCAREGASIAPAPTAAAPAGSTPGAAQPAPSSAATGEVTRGQAAPDFDLTASDGTRLKLSDLRGRPVVLYFYPKDETPGCTKQACGFRDAWSDLSKTKVVLIGVSPDDDASHKEFAAHHKLPFHLVSDPSRALAERYGVPRFGRQSFVIGPDGVLKKIYRSVDVSTHARDVLADVGS